MTVFDLNAGDCAVITKIDLTGGARARLAALGISEGTHAEVLSFSLFKSSVLISCGAVRVGIRKAYAQKIEVSV